MGVDEGVEVGVDGDGVVVDGRLSLNDGLGLLHGLGGAEGGLLLLDGGGPDRGGGRDGLGGL